MATADWIEKKPEADRTPYERNWLDEYRRQFRQDTADNYEPPVARRYAGQCVHGIPFAAPCEKCQNDTK